MSELKKCARCKKKKLVKNFTKCKSNIDGLDCYCKKCKSEKGKEFYKNNIEYYKEWWKEYFSHTDKKLDKRKRGRKNYKECLERDPGYNKKKYERQKEYQKDYLYDYEKVKRAEDDNFRLSKNLRALLRSFAKGETYSDRSEKLIGCTFEDFRAYIEKQFEQGMSWDNYGEWVIDHYWPVCEFDLTDPQQQLACFNFRNLQPLWYEENKKKGRKINWEKGK